MPSEPQDLWQSLQKAGENLATEEDYEHGYAREVRGDLRQYVAFVVGPELYALPIHLINEISKPLETTPVPRTAEFVRGIGNVRGTVIPIIDLASRLRLAGGGDERASRVLIVRSDGELFGLAVDAVVGVVQVAPEELEDAPGAISGPRGEFIDALTRHDGEILIVLDLEALLRAQDFVAPSIQWRGPR